MNTAYFYLTPEGKSLAEKLSASHPGDLYGKENFKENLRNAFAEYDYLVCIMATGIVVRILAPLIVHKTSDPAVVVLDQKGRHAISLLSGHLGGANDLAREMAFLSGGDAVITTATDVAGELSFDTFAKKYNMAIENIWELKHISGALLEGRRIMVITDLAWSAENYPELAQGKNDGKFIIYSRDDYSSLYESENKSGNFSIADMPVVVIDEGLTLSTEDSCEALPVPDPNNAQSSILPDQDRIQPQILYLRPRTICAGIGCKRNMDGPSIESALRETLKKEGLSPLSLKCISTIPLKADEEGILSTCRNLNVPLKVIPTEDIEKLDIADLGICTSDFVAQQTGVLSVSTASSYLASGKGEILVDKAKFKGITIALSKMW